MTEDSDAIREDESIVFLNGQESVLYKAELSSWQQIRARGVLGARGGRRPVIFPSLPDGRMPVLVRIPAGSTDSALRRADAARRAGDGLIARGFPVPLPAALGLLPQEEVEVPNRTSFLLFLAPFAVISFDRFLREEKESLEARAAALAVVRCLAAVHKARIRFGSIPAWNVLLTLQGAPLFVTSRAIRRRRSGRLSALRDLASLSASLEAPILSRSCRFKLLGEYLTESPLFENRRNRKKIWKRIDGEEHRLRRKGVFPLASELVELDRGKNRLVVVSQRQEELQRHGFAEPADFIAPGSRAEVLRRKEDRINCRFSTPKGRYFLKIHEKKGTDRGGSPGRLEWEGFQKLLRFGLPTPPAAAWGEAGEASFFVSRDEGGVPLDDILRATEGSDFTFRWPAARTAGRLVSLFHRAGFFHRDLYACHLLVKEERIAFIDLQRLKERYIFSMRGKIKDLAALYYSTLSTAVTRTDRIRFLKAYRGGGRLGEGDRRLAAAVIRKAQKIAKHVERGRARARRRGVGR